MLLIRMNTYVKTPHMASAGFHNKLPQKCKERGVVSQWKSWHKLTFCVLAVLGWKPMTIRARRARIHRQITLFHYSILTRHPPSSRPSFLPLIRLCPKRLPMRGGEMSQCCDGVQWKHEWQSDILTAWLQVPTANVNMFIWIQFTQPGVFNGK